MKVVTPILLVLLFACVTVSARRGPLRHMFPKNMPKYVKEGEDPGKPLFLTPYIKEGKTQEAQNLSRVGSLDGTSVVSYAGFFTVNSTYNSNMYFWFVPAETNPSTAPILLWLQGGPGGSSLFGLFIENGPFSVTKDGKLKERQWAWTKKYSMIYIDNPVGTGFSFTDNDAGYANNEDDVAVNLYSALTQFFQVFPEYQKNDFYASGESYAGKYVPAIGAKIHEENPTAKLKINFRGVLIGDGLCDPLSMFPAYPELMYQTSQIDETQKKVAEQYVQEGVDHIKKGEWLMAFETFDNFINADKTPYPSFWQNATGSLDYYNYQRTQSPVEFNYYGPYLAKGAVRKAIHVGNLTYNDGAKVEEHLLEDVAQSVRDKVIILANNYKTLFYSGQLDVIVGTTLTESFLAGLEWKGQAEYQKAKRVVWKVSPSNVEVAGYARNASGLFQVVVRGGGHILPYDQPLRTFDMVDRFITGRPFHP
ncbi:probable serine carboxypeptidase CPVL isoform X1 [Apostichopus japonicus]|uniref:probable serine carboxypeptidase CPVL isoform X1 n=1 Tax=Stichopus japonicus TaxID=307972 RepID=UPI003AB809B1